MKRVFATAVPLLLLTSVACGNTEDPGSVPEAAEATSTEFAVQVLIVTDDGAIGQNHDDEYCVWRDPSYVLRNGSGDIIATDDIDSSILGEAEAGGDPAQLGEVRSADPYTCVLPTTIQMEEFDFYELEVTVTEIVDVTFGTNGSADLEPVEATTTFSLEEAQSSDPIEVAL